MCLKSITKEEEAAVMKKLPATFPCWKAMSNHRGKTQFHNSIEPLLTRGRTHKARVYNYRRMRTEGYKPSFHVFLSIKDANEYMKKLWPHMTCYYVTKFFADKKDITKIGQTSNWRCLEGPISIAVSKITRK